MYQKGSLAEFMEEAVASLPWIKTIIVKIEPPEM